MKKKLTEMHGQIGLVDADLLEKLKMTTYQELFELLTAYQNAKERRSIQAALSEYGERIMAVTEKFQKYVASQIE